MDNTTPALVVSIIIGGAITLAAIIVYAVTVREMQKIDDITNACIDAGKPKYECMVLARETIKDCR